MKSRDNLRTSSARIAYNEGFPEKSKSSRFKIKKLNQISSKSKSLTIELSKSFADAHLPSFSAGVLAHFRRCGALSEGWFPPERSFLAHEIKFDHWPKKAYFRRFSASCARKLSPGFPNCSSEKIFLGSGPLQTWSVSCPNFHIGDMLGLLLLHGRLVGIAEAAWILLLF